MTMTMTTMMMMMAVYILCLSLSFVTLIFSILSCPLLPPPHPRSLPSSTAVGAAPLPFPSLVPSFFHSSIPSSLPSLLPRAFPLVLLFLPPLRPRSFPLPIEDGGGSNSKRAESKRSETKSRRPPHVKWWKEEPTPSATQDQVKEIEMGVQRLADELASKHSNHLFCMTVTLTTFIPSLFPTLLSWLVSSFVPPSSPLPLPSL